LVAAYYAAVTCKTLAGEPSVGYEPDQRMTRQQALKAYTLDGV
jgi:predicted amidohydrolase YtcJ